MIAYFIHVHSKPKAWNVDCTCYITFKHLLSHCKDSEKSPTPCIVWRCRNLWEEPTLIISPSHLEGKNWPSFRENGKNWTSYRWLCTECSSGIRLLPSLQGATVLGYSLPARAAVRANVCPSGHSCRNRQERLYARDEARFSQENLTFCHWSAWALKLIKMICLIERY